MLRLANTLTYLNTQSADSLLAPHEARFVCRRKDMSTSEKAKVNWKKTVSVAPAAPKGSFPLPSDGSSCTTVPSIFSQEYTEAKEGECRGEKWIDDNGNGNVSIRCEQETNLRRVRVKGRFMSLKNSNEMSDFRYGNRVFSYATGDQNYSVHVAKDPEEVRSAQVLRFQVFNLELNEGLQQSYATGMDCDEFDAVCDHLVVEETQSREVVGTYRLQTGGQAACNHGYYSAGEFDLAPYELVRNQVVELGRACVHRRHRNLVVLGLLWKGIALYAREKGGRYLIGCSSLTSQDPAEGASMYSLLARKHLVEPDLRTLPLPEMACPLDHIAESQPKVPKLLGAYLTIGARICGPPAIDRHFKTIDFLTLLDLQRLPINVIDRYLR